MFIASLCAVFKTYSGSESHTLMAKTNEDALYFPIPNCSMVIVEMSKNAELLVMIKNRGRSHERHLSYGAMHVLAFGNYIGSVKMIRGSMTVVALQSCSTVIPVWNETYIESLYPIESTQCVVAHMPECHSAVWVGVNSTLMLSSFDTDDQNDMMIYDSTLIWAPKVVVMHVQQADSYFFNSSLCVPTSSWDIAPHVYDVSRVSPEIDFPAPSPTPQPTATPEPKPAKSPEPLAWAIILAIFDVLLVGTLIAGLLAICYEKLKEHCQNRNTESENNDAELHDINDVTQNVENHQIQPDQTHETDEQIQSNETQCDRQNQAPPDEVIVPLQQFVITDNLL